MRIIPGIIVLVCALLLTSCASPKVVKTPAQEPTIVEPSPPQVQNRSQPTVISTARKMLGTPYRYGGATPNGFDCSGLVTYSYHSVGIKVPRTSSAQFHQAKKVPLNQLQAGDLLFFRLRPPKVSHVAIYDRNGRFIHAPSSGKQVSYASLNNPYWRKHLVGAGRF